MASVTCGPGSAPGLTFVLSMGLPKNELFAYLLLQTSARWQYHLCDFREVETVGSIDIVSVTF